jgi:glycosyltransferase involved in cell wall biosynthesis
MKKVLIYFDESNIMPVGGPSGYLFYLKKGLEQISSKDIQISFLNVQSSAKGTVKRYAPDFIKQCAKACLYYKDFSDSFHHRTAVDLNQFDIVHFHVVKDVFEARDSLKDFRGRILLTSHSPCLPANEIFDSLTKWEKLLPVYKHLERVDQFAFNAADTFVFPSQESEDPYFHSSSWYKDVRAKKNIQYCLTGVSDTLHRQKQNQEFDSLRNQLGIPQDATLISYIGRHNTIKGYDNLLKIGSKIFEQTDKVYFVIAGGQSPLKGLDHPHWIELGWTDKPLDIMRSSDLFVLPNRETFFDLSLLESLSQGTRVLASDTGGNKVFRQSSPMVSLFSNNAQCVNLILQYADSSSQEKKVLSQKSRDLYLSNYTDFHFAQRYLDLLRGIEI